MTVSSARANFVAALAAAERGEAVEITRRGKPVAALVSRAQLERLDGRTGFAEALVAYHERHAGEIDPNEDVFGKVRDRSPGRRSPW